MRRRDARAAGASWPEDPGSFPRPGGSGERARSRPPEHPSLGLRCASCVAARLEVGDAAGERLGRELARGRPVLRQAPRGLAPAEQPAELLLRVPGGALLQEGGQTSRRMGGRQVGSSKAAVLTTPILKAFLMTLCLSLRDILVLSNRRPAPRGARLALAKLRPVGLRPNVSGLLSPPPGGGRLPLIKRHGLLSRRKLSPPAANRHPPARLCLLKQFGGGRAAGTSLVRARRVPSCAWRYHQAAANRLCLLVPSRKDTVDLGP